VTVGVEHIDLDAGVDHHQHRQQGLARGAIAWQSRSARDLRPVLDDVTGEPVRQALQRFLLMLGGDVPAEQTDERTVGKQQQRQRQRSGVSQRNGVTALIMARCFSSNR
jgi:hypothetical protein